MTNPYPELEEEIVRMAIEAGFLPGDLELFPETIHMFAHLICQSQYIDVMALLRKALMIEREACAQLCDAEHKARLAQNIRARVNPIVDIKDQKLCTSDKCAYFSDKLPQEPIGYLCENAAGHRYFRWKKPNSVYKPIALYSAPGVVV